MTSTTYRYCYEPRKKYICPNCGQKTLKRFIDTTTGELLPDEFGVCERIFNCSYEKRPEKEIINKPHVERPPLFPFYFTKEILLKTLGLENKNTLFCYFSHVFGTTATKNAFSKYKVGTSYSGDTIFWQIDEQEKIRAGKKIQYFSDGHRNKARGASWLHWSNGFVEGRHELKQCLFGQHLMKGEYKSIFVVESEKTALICEICKNENDVLFLACGGMQNLGLVAGLRVKPGQRLFYIPDNDSNEIWQSKIDKLGLPGKIKIIPALQQMKPGSDIGDLLLNIK